MASHNVDTSSARPKKGSCTDRSCVICRLLTYVWKYCNEPIMPRPSKMSWPNCPLPSTPIFSQEMSCPSKHYKNLITDFFVFGIFRLQCLQWIHQLTTPFIWSTLGGFQRTWPKVQNVQITTCCTQQGFQGHQLGTPQLGCCLKHRQNGDTGKPRGGLRGNS